MLVLSVLESAPLHGYALLEELRRRSGGELDLPEGTVYPALHRLEERGWVSSRWEASSGRRRRVYAPTVPGLAALVRERGEWGAFSRAVTRVVGGAS
jgi:DNA-binding PadR family transcriptional regulator